MKMLVMELSLQLYNQNNWNALKLLNHIMAGINDEEARF
jgi:hypothetical protein